MPTSPTPAPSGPSRSHQNHIPYESAGIDPSSAAVRARRTIPHGAPVSSVGDDEVWQQQDGEQRERGGGPGLPDE